MDEIVQKMISYRLNYTQRKKEVPHSEGTNSVEFEGTNSVESEGTNSVESIGQYYYKLEPYQCLLTN